MFKTCFKPCHQGKKKVIDAQKSSNFNEEYCRALRTKSYAEFFNKAQLLAKQPSICFNYKKLSEILLEPEQETIPSIVDTAMLSKTSSKLKNLIISYFEISAEASQICSNLLKCINQVKSSYKFIQRALDLTMDNSDHESNFNFKLIIIELNSFISSSDNPFSSIVNGEEFKHISDKHSSVLHQLKSMKKKLGKKIKIIKHLKKTSRICVTAVFGLVAITATVIATHTLTTLIMGPVILSLPYKSLMKKLRIRRRLRFSGSKFLSKVFDQIDVAAKGAYILNRDFDTTSRIVARIHDEIEHSRGIVKFCLERKEDKLCLEIVKDLKKSDYGFRKQVDELEEHVYLCLVTINRARGLVIKEIMTQYRDIN